MDLSTGVGIASLVGLCLGSFLNVVRYRWPKAEDAQFKEAAREELGFTTEGHTGGIGSGPMLKAISCGGSACPSCGRKLTAIELVPVLSWLAQKGKCKGCSAPVSGWYPAVELFTAIAFGAVFAVFGITWAAVAVASFVWFATALSLIDLDHQYLPDTLSKGLMLSLGAYLALGVSGLSLQDSLLAAMAAYFVVGNIIPAVLTAITGRQAIGSGDAPLLAMLGAVVGVTTLPTAVFVCCMVSLTLIPVGKLASKGELRIPMGPGILLTTAGWMFAHKLL